MISVVDDRTKRQTQRRADDRSEDHLRWLVENRSRNQRATLDLYLLLENHSVAINGSVVYTDLLQELAAIVFSLWRAVFLTDLTETPQARMVDVEGFLGTLISHNTIAYIQDRGARDWTFPYYLKNARLRLHELAIKPPYLVELADIDIQAKSAKDDWLIAQAALEKAVKRLGALVVQKA